MKSSQVFVMGSIIFFLVNKKMAELTQNSSGDLWSWKHNFELFFKVNMSFNETQKQNMSVSAI